MTWSVPREYKTPKRALKQLLFMLRITAKGVWKQHARWPRPAYCACCGAWSWSTWEHAARTSEAYGFLCEECAEENDYEWDCAWAEYYGGRL